MGRKHYQADLQAATDSLPSSILSLALGDDDGAFNFIYRMPSGPDAIAIDITALVQPDLSDYPREHSFLTYTTSENAPPLLEKTLSDLTLGGLKISSFLSSLCAILDKECQRDESGCDSDVDFGEDDFNSDGLEDPNVSDLDDEFFAATSSQSKPDKQKLPTLDQQLTGSQLEKLEQRIRQDLKAVKDAGFRLSFKGDLLGNQCYLIISIRVAHLEINEDTLKAWDLNNKEYLTVIIRYNAGYRVLEKITNGMASQGVDIRVLLSEEPTISNTELAHVCGQPGSETMFKGKKTTRELFIGRPLNELMNERLSYVLKYRTAMGMSWQGAEDFFNDFQARPLNDDAIDAKYYLPEDSTKLERFPVIVRTDHLEGNIGSHCSFPLLAMQFCLRHLVRCTEFCLVCHCHIEATFEALKPYVCSKPLCLYQYMSLGFGPSIEREILSQPHVVDLLISFCYNAAASNSLREYPLGMGLMIPISLVGHVPVQERIKHYPFITASAGVVKALPSASNEIARKVEFDEARSDLIFRAGTKDPSLTVGQWIHIQGTKLDDEHRRVLEVCWPIVHLGPAMKSAFPGSTMSTHVSPDYLADPYGSPAARSSGLPPPGTSTPPRDANLPSGHREVTYTVWNCQFDELGPLQQCSAICGLLTLLPSVTNMTSYLKSQPEKAMSLQKWVECIPPATLGILRWIIASNRSCIVQVDNLDESCSSREDRVFGMRGYVQFRFASGAPDKEQRFLDAVKLAQEEETVQHPTIFAWHGSALGNWHSIIRTGLDFSETMNGRAYGNGVYHSLDATTSQQYMHMRADAGTWHSSELGISQALCLNEIVNLPQKYVSSSPHLVVAQLDWIQTRYLFVKTNIKAEKIKESDMAPSLALPQDPQRTPMNLHRQAIVIPVNAISTSRYALYAVKSTNKRAKLSLGAKGNPCYISDDSDEEINSFLAKEQLEPKMPTIDRTKLPFTPGILDQKTLPLLAQPSYATPKASKALQRELLNIQKIQDSQPQQELGWYIDLEAVTNLYQWIFELHSFENTLPLAKDMEQAGLQSIVLELRFGKDYPFSPPFVRVIRPRFLPFLQGGGGHVTAGGAMCMQLLTNSGWNVASTIEAVLLQVRIAITSMEPKPARLFSTRPRTGRDHDYGSGEAREAYIRACHTHGWTIPPDFNETASMAAKIDGPARY